MFRNTLIIAAIVFVMADAGYAQIRRWTTADGLPTNEVRQIVELGNGQMLVGCEGQYCLTVGESFVPVECHRADAVRLDRFSSRYGHLWQGDSLLWLHDLYRLYLFDARTRTFRTIGNEIPAQMHDFASGKIGMEFMSDVHRPTIDSVGLRDQCMTATTDRQGGLWIGTRDQGIAYLPPRRQRPLTLHDDSLMHRVRSALNSRATLPQLPYRHINFTCDLPDGRVLIGHDLNRLSYCRPEQAEFTSVEQRALANYRNLVGVVPIDGRWAVVYSQNGAFMLDIKSDTIAGFPPARDIETWTDKYNCMLLGRDGTLWVGTQDGLFKTRLIPSMEVDEYQCERIGQLSNNCIRSLVFDADGRVWAGTSCGISRITPTVINFMADDGIPEVSMMERAAMLLSDSTIVFAHGSRCTMFRPEWLLADAGTSPVQLLTLAVNGSSRIFEADRPLSLAYDENYVTARFSTLDFARTMHTRYRYRLNGLERQWHDARPVKGYAEAAYTALPPGNYTLELQAASADGAWGTSALQTIVIRPPFWLTWWAKAIYGLIGLVALVVLVGYYIARRLAALERDNDDRVNRLFEMREEARHQFAESTNIDPTKIGINLEEENLVAAMLRAIEAHMADSEYGVDELASDVAMSRSKLYDRLRNILGCSPADFIRNVRLKRAARMLTETQLPIAEISVRVGFGTTRNFSTQFKKMFGLLPSEYRGRESR